MLRTYHTFSLKFGSAPHKLRKAVLLDVRKRCAFNWLDSEVVNHGCGPDTRAHWQRDETSDLELSFFLLDEGSVTYHHMVSIPSAAMSSIHSRVFS